MTSLRLCTVLILPKFLAQVLSTFTISSCVGWLKKKKKENWKTIVHINEGYEAIHEKLTFKTFIMLAAV